MNSISKTAQSPRKISFFGQYISHLRFRPKIIDPIEKVICMYHCIVFLGLSDWNGFSYMHDYRHNKFCMYYHIKLSARAERHKRRLKEIE